MTESTNFEGRKPPERFLTCLFFGLTSLGLLAALLGIFINDSWNWWVWNADALGQFTLARDLAGGGQLGSWNLGNATYFVPDLVFAFLANFFLPNVEIVVLSNVIFQLAFLSFAVIKFAKATFHPHPYTMTALAVSGLAALSATIGEPFALLLTSAHHANAFSAGLLLLAIALKQKGRHRNRLLVISTTVSLFALSDDLFTLSYAIPVAGVVSALPIRTTVARTQVAIVIFISALAGRLIGNALPGELNSLPRQISLSSLRSNGANIIEVILFPDSRSPAIGIAVLLFAGYSFMTGIKFFPRRDFSPPATSNLSLVLLLSLSTVTTTIPLLLGLGSPIAERYMLHIFFIPIVFLASVLTRIASTTQLLPLAGFIAFTFFFIADLERKDASPWHPWNSALACVINELDRSDSKQVITQYWDTHALTLMSERSRVFAQFLSSGEQYVNVTSTDWYSPNGWYDAAILSSYAGPVHTFSPNQFVTKSGSPITSAVCGPWTILTAEADSLGFSAYHSSD